MARAILIDPNEDPQWIELDADVRSHLAKLFPSGQETVELHRDDWTHFNDGPGIKVAVSECASVKCQPALPVTVKSASIGLYAALTLSRRRSSSTLRRTRPIKPM
mgnify:CR=1 FL=1